MTSAGCCQEAPVPCHACFSIRPLALTTWLSLSSEQVIQERTQRSHSVFSELALEITHCHFRMAPVDYSTQSIDMWEVGIAREYLEAAYHTACQYLLRLLRNLKCSVLYYSYVYPFPTHFVRFLFPLEFRLASLSLHILKFLGHCIQYMSHSIEKLEPQPLHGYK